MKTQLRHQAAKVVRDNLKRFNWGRYHGSPPSFASVRRMGFQFDGLSKKASAELVYSVAAETRLLLQHRKQTKTDCVSPAWRYDGMSAEALKKCDQTDNRFWHAQLNRPVGVRLAEYKKAVRRKSEAAAKRAGEVLRVAELLRSVDQLFLVGRRWNGCMGFRGREETSLHHSMPVKEALTFLAELDADSFGCGLDVYIVKPECSPRAVSGVDSDREFTTTSGDWRFSQFFNGEPVKPEYPSNWRGQFAADVLAKL